MKFGEVNVNGRMCIGWLYLVVYFVALCCGVMIVCMYVCVHRESEGEGLKIVEGRERTFERMGECMLVSFPCCFQKIRRHGFTAALLISVRLIRSVSYVIRYIYNPLNHKNEMLMSLVKRNVM